MQKNVREPEKDLRVAKTRYAMTRALAKLLRDKPLEKISITELCNAAQINRKTFYLHFETVQDVFDYILERLRDRYIDIQKQCHDEKGIYDLQTAVEMMLEMIEENLEYSQNLVCGTARDHLLLSTTEMCTEVRLSYMGEKERHDPVVRRIQHFMNGGYITTIFDWLCSDDEMSGKELADISNNLFLLIRSKYKMGTIKQR